MPMKNQILSICKTVVGLLLLAGLLSAAYWLFLHKKQLEMEAKTTTPPRLSAEIITLGGVRYAVFHAGNCLEVRNLVEDSIYAAPRQVP